MAFIGISMINSTIGIVSIMGLLIIYAAVINNASAPLKLSLLPTLFSNNTILVLLRMTTIVLGLYVLSIILLTAQADRENKIASILEKKMQVKKALQIMPDLEHALSQDPDYWKNYALLHFRDQNYYQAIACLDKAKKWSSLPDLYLASGLCYEKLDKYAQAIDQYNELVLLLPSKFGYRFRLMNAYLKNKDTVNTITVGEGILDLEPKIHSLQVEQCKKATLNLLKRLKIQEDIYLRRNPNVP